MSTTFIVVIAVIVVLVGLYFFGMREKDNKALHYRAMSADAPEVPMSEETMPHSTTEYEEEEQTV